MLVEEENDDDDEGNGNGSNKLSKQPFLIPSFAKRQYSEYHSIPSTI